MSRLARSPSRGVFAQSDNLDAVLSTPLSGMGCSCGAADQLENERLKLVVLSQFINDRSESLLQIEAGAEDRMQELEASLQMMIHSDAELQEHHVDVDNKLFQLHQLQHELSQRDERLRRYEEELQQQKAKLQDLEQETTAHEEAAAQEELSLIEERNRLEDEIEQLREECVMKDARAAVLSRKYKDCGRQCSEVEHEQQLLDGDKQLLAEIENQVKPVSRNLAERESRIRADEAHVIALEAECDRREAHLFPEYQRVVKSLSILEERARELHLREEESKQQLSELLQQQRKLGGMEIRLSGLEGALQRQSHILSTGQNEVENPDDIEKIQERLALLKNADTKWAERVCKQQHDIKHLEAKVEDLESRREFRPQSRVLKNEFIKPSNDWSSAKRNSGLVMPRLKGESST